MIPAAGAHGGDGHAVARALGRHPADVVDLSMSLNPFALDVVALAARHLDALRSYPDDRAATCALAEAMRVDPDRLRLTNGGSEAIALVAASVGGFVDEPEFSLHPRGDDGPRWRSNPHNPSGRLAAPDERAGVWDEAFYPLATGEWTRRDAGAIVVGSLTKVFACPGLRLGYVLVPDDAAVDDLARIARGRPQWSVNGLASAVLPDLLARADLRAWRDAIASRRAELGALLAAHGLVVRPSDAPWLLVDAPGLRERLAPHGVVVRDCASFGLDGVARVAVPDDRGMERLARALEALA